MAASTGFINVLRAFNEAGVDYVLIGGLATIAHGYFRPTLDIDAVIHLDRANVDKAMAALEGLGYTPRAPVPARDFGDAEKRRQWIEEKNMVDFTMLGPSADVPVVDLFPRYPLPWDKLRADSIKSDAMGVEVRVCSLQHLLELKRAAGRDKDRADVRMLEAIAADRGDEETHE